MRYDGEQFFCHFELWEDWQNGMYEINSENPEEIIILSKNFLSNQELFYNLGKQMLESWRIAAKVNLTNNSCNKRAWIGQASCCFSHKAPEILTRLAWNQMERIDQEKANKTATILFNEWKRKALFSEQNLFRQECL